MLDVKATKMEEGPLQKIRTYDKSAIYEFMKNILISCIKSWEFSLQINGSADVDNLELIMVFMRYSYKDSFQGDLLLCKS